VDDMYLAETAHKGLTKLQSKEGWLAQSVRVFDGDFTVESDKYTLVNVILGLYGFTVVCGKDEGGLQALIDVDKEGIFPDKYVGGLCTRLEVELAKVRTDDGESIFKEADFENILAARKAFLQIHGKDLRPELKKRLTSRRFSDGNAPPAATTSTHGASHEVAEVEVQILKE